MKWIVTGASKTTGRDVKLTLEASCYDDAEALAYDTGLVITSIEMVNHAAPPTTPFNELASPVGSKSGNHPVAIEKTNKQWKAGMLVGLLMVILSVPGCVVMPVGGIALFSIGIIVFVIFRFAAWWNNG